MSLAACSGPRNSVGLKLERIWPSIIGASVGIVYIVFCRDYRAPDAAKDLLGAGVSIGAIAVGFLANMMAILFSIEKKRIVQQLKVLDLFNSVVDYLYYAIVASSCFALFSAVGLIVDLKSHPRVYPYAVAVWLFSAVTTVATYWRVIGIFTKLLKSQ